MKFKIRRHGYLTLLFVYLFFTCLPIWAKTFDVGSLQLTQISDNGQGPSYIFLPGGPGISSDYLKPLTSRLNVNGSIWHLDYPDRLLDPQDSAEEILHKWKNSLIEVAKSFSYPIFIGHSFGGMLILDTPKLKSYLKGVVLLSTAPVPDESAQLKSFSSQLFLSALEEFESNKTQENLKMYWLSMAPLFFNNESINNGVELLKTCKFYPTGVSMFSFFMGQYFAKWIPDKKNTLIITGENDLVEPINMYNNMSEFSGHIKGAFIIKKAGHFPWVENLDDTIFAFENYFKKMESSN